MFGPEVMIRSLAEPSVQDSFGNRWGYHSRSDQHSKIACWCLLADLLAASPLLRQHVADGRVGYGLNHKMVDWKNNRTKKLDLVIATGPTFSAKDDGGLLPLADICGVVLDDASRAAAAALPPIRRVDAGSVLVAVEAKACMTAHQRALPRLHDELNSSQATVRGASTEAMAVGFVMINRSETFVSPDRNRRSDAFADPVVSRDPQPKSALITAEKIRQLPRRSAPGEEGFDALAVVVVEMVNDGTPPTLISDPPAPPPGDTFAYGRAIERMAFLYAARFKQL